MKHIMLSQGFKYGEDPFPAFRCSLVFGRNKFDKAFLPVKDLELDEEGLLPQNQFKVIKTKEKGTILIVPGEDTTNRCLLFCGCCGGFRGGVALHETDGTILAKAEASNACDSAIEVVALLDIGQSITFHSIGRRNNNFIKHTWDGQEIETKNYTRSEFESMSVVEMDAETL